jgi:hypothetical protein
VEVTDKAVTAKPQQALLCHLAMCGGDDQGNVSSGSAIWLGALSYATRDGLDHLLERCGNKVNSCSLRRHSADRLTASRPLRSRHNAAVTSQRLRSNADVTAQL